MADSLSEWQPAIVTWGEGPPRRACCEWLRGKRFFVRKITCDHSEACDTGAGLIFEIRADELPEDIRADGVFLICEHDFISD